MSRIVISLYNPKTDNEGAKALCRIPVSGNIALSLEREPDYEAGAYLQCEQPEIYVCRRVDTGQICGLFNVGWRHIYINGEVRQQRYFSDLRIDPNFQKSRLFYQIIRFTTANQLIPNGQDAAQTIVFADNEIMQNMIQKRQGDKRFPNYHFAGDYFTQIIPLASRQNPLSCPPQYHVKKATEKDVFLMQSFSSHHAPTKQAYPYYDYAKMDTPYYNGLSINDYYLAFDGDKLLGFCAIWHQKNIKQTRIVAYSSLFSIARPIINLFAKLTGGFQLPTEGSVLHYFYVHNILIEHNNPLIFEALLHQIKEDYRHKGFHYFMVGLCEKDDLLSIFSKIRNKRTIQGKLYWVNDGTPPTSFLDNRQLYLDISRI